MNIDPLLALGILMLGMGLGALLTKLRHRGAIQELIRDELAASGSIDQEAIGR
jgi:hypothetical protein